MSGVRIYITTSEGPVRIQSILAEDAVDETEPSAVCLNGTATRLGITKDYTYFVRDHIRPLTGKGVYRMDLDGRVDGGNSWMLGSWLAHQLLHGGGLSMHEDEAELAVFTTGQVAFSPGVERTVEIREVGHITDKVTRMVSRVEEEVKAGRRVLFLVPQANAAAASVAVGELPETLQGAVKLYPVATGDEVFALLPNVGQLRPVLNSKGNAEFVSHRGTNPNFLKTAGKRGQIVKVLSLIALLIAGGVMGGGYYIWQEKQRDWRALWRDGSYAELVKALETAPISFLAEHFRQGIEAEAKGKAKITVFARRPADGNTCAGLRFRNSPLGEFELPTISKGDYRLDRPRTLCGFTVKVDGTEPTLGGHLWFALLREKNANVRISLLPLKRTNSGPVTSRVLTISQDLPLYRSDAWRWRVIAVWTPGSSATMTTLFDKKSLKFDENALKPMAQLGIPISRARIKLVTTARSQRPIRLAPN